MRDPCRRRSGGAVHVRGASSRLGPSSASSLEALFGRYFGSRDDDGAEKHETRGPQRGVSPPRANRSAVGGERKAEEFDFGGAPRKLDACTAVPVRPGPRGRDFAAEVYCEAVCRKRPVCEPPHAVLPPFAALKHRRVAVHARCARPSRPIGPPGGVSAGRPMNVRATSLGPLGDGELTDDEVLVRTGEDTLPGRPAQLDVRRVPPTGLELVHRGSERLVVVGGEPPRPVGASGPAGTVAVSGLSRYADGFRSGMPLRCGGRRLRRSARTEAPAK